jgi:hypothetical protein
VKTFEDEVGRGYDATTSSFKPLLARCRGGLSGGESAEGEEELVSVSIPGEPGFKGASVPNGRAAEAVKVDGL